ncbi:MAG: CopD family protein [Thermomicrobiales bacterium]
MSSRFRIQFIAVLAVLLAVLATPVRGSAHASLIASDPVAGAILPVAPVEVRLTFDEQLDPESVSARLVDNLGADVAGSSYRVENGIDLIVGLSSDLPDGTYSIIYQIISIADGDSVTGYLPFTIGNASELRPISATIDVDDGSGAPQWLDIGSRWLAYAGTLGALAIWPIWLFVIAPAMKRRTTAMRPALSTVRRFSILAFFLATLGNVGWLIAQALDRDDALVDAVRDTLLESRFGDLWLLRMLTLGVLATLLSLIDWVHPNRRQLANLAALTASILLIVPFSLDSHASDLVVGRTFAIVNDGLHLISAGIWGGGIVLLACVLLDLRKRIDTAQFRKIIVSVVPRFSALAIASWILLIVSGAYSSWLQVGNLDAARATAYGNAFLIKIAIALVALAFGATQFFVIAKRLDSERWDRRFGRLLVAESLGFILILLASGWLTSEVTARDEIFNGATGVSRSLNQNDVTAQMLIVPGAAGPNHYQINLDSPVPEGSQAFLRLTPPGDLFDQVEVPLTIAGPNIWENHGSELSVAGDWQIDVVIRTPGENDWQASVSAPIDATAPALPAQPWRFGRNALVGLVMLVIGAIAVGRTLGMPGGRSRRETAGIGIAGLAIGAAFLLSARLEPPPAFALADDETIARGSAVYAEQCLACHGVTGQGNGPEAAGLPVAPADFTDPIHQIHTDESLATYIQNGFPLSGMPPFEDVLSPGEIADVIAYLRSLFVGESSVETPAAADCTIEPRPIESLVSITVSTDLPATDLGAWPVGDAATSEESDAVAATIRQFVACSNAGDYERVLATETVGYLAPQFANLDDAGRAQAVTLASQPQPLAPDEMRSIERIEPARRLDDGRLATQVVTLDPVNHPHQLEATVILALEDGIWRIDEIILPEPETSVSVASEWPITATSGDYTLSLTVGDPSAQGRPLRLEVTDSAGTRIDGATGTIILVPQGVGVPGELELINVDPGFTSPTRPQAVPEPGLLTFRSCFPDGTELNAGFTFVL